MFAEDHLDQLDFGLPVMPFGQASIQFLRSQELLGRASFRWIGVAQQLRF